MSLHQMNAQFMFERNGTAEWMERNLTDADHKYLRQFARSTQQSKLEQKRRQELVEADEAAVVAKKKKIEETEQKEREKLDALYKIKLVVVQEEVLRLNVKTIKEQIAVWQRWDKEVPPVGKLNGAGAPGQKERQVALLAAIQRANGQDPRPARNS
ncbi:hypothetical protein MIND_00980500 [Mycena indigotica]|uniref:Uncharacterized protein n=1 Tax=Mycena indigotica TaxID=2126181 RepID=A0A8H6W0V1_9AGAR|nr:uncharacterized protein MIND_00980500 [Mycena indigotica]KAF7297468.1 hypothetical protein MIND_00980500 [Mycena indigotica]